MTPVEIIFVCPFNNDRLGKLCPIRVKFCKASGCRRVNKFSIQAFACWSVLTCGQCKFFFHSIKMKRKLYLYKMKSSEMFLEELVFSKTRFYYSLKLASLQNSCRQLNLLRREEVRLLKSGQIGLRDALNNAINSAPS